jgi:LPXTG-motif cell wall-anchored protein
VVVNDANVDDYGLAPTSYDQGSVATHTTGSLKLGANVTPDYASNFVSSTNPDAVKKGEAATGDDGTRAFAGPVALGKAGSEFSIEVAVTGVTAQAYLCSWIDFDGNGLFDNPAERACATVNPGDTTAKLAWAVPTKVTTSPTYARLRLSYDSAVNSPLGRVGSGEVEDYSVTFAGPSKTTSALPTTGKSSEMPAIVALYTLVIGLFVLGRRRTLR